MTTTRYVCVFRWSFWFPFKSQKATESFLRSDTSPANLSDPGPSCCLRDPLEVFLARRPFNAQTCKRRGAFCLRTHMEPFWLRLAGSPMYIYIYIYFSWGLNIHVGSFSSHQYSIGQLFFTAPSHTLIVVPNSCPDSYQTRSLLKRAYLALV